MSKSLNLQSLKTKLIPTVIWVKKHRIVIGIVLIIVLYGWMVLQINSFSQREPSDDAVNEKLQTIKRPKIEQSTIDKIEQLQDNNVEVQSLFKAARENPFQE